MKKLNKRERFLVIFILVLVACYGLYEYVLFPFMQDIKTYETDIQLNLDREKQLQEMLKTSMPLSDKVQTLFKKVVDLEQILPSSVQQEALTTIILNAFPETQFKIQNLSFSVKTDTNASEQIQPNVEEINDVLTRVQDAIDKGITLSPATLGASFPIKSFNSSQSENDSETASTSSESKPLFSLINAELLLAGDYDNLERAISYLELNKRLVLVERLTITKSSEGSNGVTALLSLQFPVYTDFVSRSDETYQINSELGVSRPFSYSTIGSIIEQIQQLAERPTALPDFTIQLSPITSDASTVMLNKTSERIASVYANLNQMVEGTLELKKTDTGLSYRYQVHDERYPSSGFIKFTPVGKDIIIEVLSKSRNDVLDQSGLKLTVKNDTGYKVKFYVYFEDETSPRLVIANPSSTIVLEKK